MLVPDQLGFCCESQQGTLTEGEGSVQLTSLSDQIRSDAFVITNIFFLFLKKTSYLNEEVKRTEPSSLVSIPWFPLTHPID
jgi:hypothetical protein